VVRNAVEAMAELPPERRRLTVAVSPGGGGAVEIQVADRGPGIEAADVRRVVPSARSVVCLGTVYNTDRPYSVEQHDPARAEISRYAWGGDYHDVVGARTQALLGWMRAESPEAFEARAYVDTGPVQERVYAQRAGLGWIGKNTCVIHPEIGSWLFLSEIITSLALEAGAPAFDQVATPSPSNAALPMRPGR